MNPNYNESDYFDLEDVIEDNAFILLPEGVYTFQVNQLDLNDRFKGTDKIQPCRMVVVHFTVYTPEGQRVQQKENFIFYKPMAWKIFQFFRSLGLLQNNDLSTKIPWLMAQGCWGRAKINVRTWYSNGNERKSNGVEAWIEPDENVLKANAKAIETYRASLAKAAQAQSNASSNTPF